MLVYRTVRLNNITYLNISQAPNSGLDIIPLLSLHRPQLGLSKAGEIGRRHRRRRHHGSKEGRHRRHGRKGRRAPDDCLHPCNGRLSKRVQLFSSSQCVSKNMFVPDHLWIKILQISDLWERRRSRKKESVPGWSGGIWPICRGSCAAATCCSTLRGSRRRLRSRRWRLIIVVVVYIVVVQVIVIVVCCGDSRGPLREEVLCVATHERGSLGSCSSTAWASPLKSNHDKSL